MDALVDEVCELLTVILGTREVVRQTYGSLFISATGLDPLGASINDLVTFCSCRGKNPPPFATVTDGLQYVMAEFIEPGLNPSSITIVSRYPADQAVFARLSPDDPRTALRFEAYCGGMELANGFEELGNWSIPLHLRCL